MQNESRYRMLTSADAQLWRLASKFRSGGVTYVTAFRRGHRRVFTSFALHSHSVALASPRLLPATTTGLAMVERQKKGGPKKKGKKPVGRLKVWGTCS